MQAEEGNTTYNRGHHLEEGLEHCADRQRQGKHGQERADAAVQHTGTEPPQCITEVVLRCQTGVAVRDDESMRKVGAVIDRQPQRKDKVHLPVSVKCRKKDFKDVSTPSGRIHSSQHNHEGRTHGGHVSLRCHPLDADATYH